MRSVSGTGYAVCQTESHPARSPCLRFQPEWNCVPPHFRRKTAVWCSVLETCEASVTERAACHGSGGALEVNAGWRWGELASVGRFDCTPCANFDTAQQLNANTCRQWRSTALGWISSQHKGLTHRASDRPAWSINSWSLSHVDTNPFIT